MVLNCSGFGRWAIYAMLALTQASTAAAQAVPDSPLPVPGEPRGSQNADPGVRAGSTADTGIGEVGRRLDTATESIKPLRSPLRRIQNRVENRIRNRIDRNYDPTANATAPFERAERSIRPL